MALTLEQIKALVKKRKSASIETGPVNFGKLVEWKDSEDFTDFISDNNLVKKAYVRVSDNSILFHVGVDVLITKAD